MKRTLISTAASLGCLIVASTALIAQSSNLNYEIPFSFNAAGIEMPAGHYSVVAQSGDVAVLRGPVRSIAFQTGPQLSAKARAAHLTFHKYGDAYFLREVWDQSGRGNKVSESPREREMRQTELQARLHPRSVLVAATR